MNFHPAFIAQVKRNRAVAIYTLVGAADRFLLRVGVIHHEGVEVGTDIALVRSNRRLGALKKPKRQFVRQLAQLRPLGIEPLAHPDTGGDFRDPQSLFEEAIMTKRLDRLEVALTKRQEPHHRLDQVRGLHPLRDRKFWVDYRFHLRRLAALPRLALLATGRARSYNFEQHSTERRHDHRRRDELGRH